MPKFEEATKISTLLEGDGSEVKEQLVLSGLLLLLFERFKDYVIGQIDFLYCDDFFIKKENMSYVRGEEFKKIIDEKGKGNKGQHGDKAFRAALKQIHEFGAISEVELKKIESLALLRNDIGHELFRILVDDNKPVINSEDIFFLFDIHLKVVRWWLKEFEASMNPDLYYGSVDFDSADSMETLLFEEVINKALRKAK